MKPGKKKNIGIPSFVRNKQQQTSFIRRLFDTDGSIYYCRSNFKTKNISLYSIFHYKPKIKLGTISEKLIYQVNKILINLGFHPSLRKPYRQRENENTMFSLELHRKSDIKKWLKIIGFKNYKHLSKTEVANRFGFCPPYTTSNQRIKMINNLLAPLESYPQIREITIEKIKKTLQK